MKQRLIDRLEGHWQAVAWTQRKQRLRFNRMTRNQAESIALRHGSQNQLCFHHGKMTANAHTWATTEREIGVARASSNPFGGEMLRVERSEEHTSELQSPDHLV